jgi:hypothetical protein
MAEQRDRAWLIKFILIFNALIFSTSCVPSLQPFYTEKDLILESDLVGDWVDERDNDSWTFQITEEKRYDLILPITEKTQAGMDAHLLRIGRTIFLDLYPKEPQKAEFRSNVYKMHFIPAHTISKIQIEQDSLSVSFLSSTWIAESIEQDKIKIPHIKTDGIIILTASTAELQQFLLENLDNPEAFEKPTRLRRKQKESLEKKVEKTKPQVTQQVKPEQNNQSLPKYEFKSVFEFHNGFWINLHHFLYEQALLISKPKGRPVSTDEPVKTDKLTPAQKQIWDASIKFYQQELISRDLLFDEEMVKIKDRLEDLEKAADLKNSELNPDLIKVLEQAAPIYRAHWWTEHEQANRNWIENQKPLLQRFEDQILGQLNNLYQSKLPPTPIRIDVTTYANWSGAYTSIDPVRITISSIDKRHFGFASLETIFHETSHALIRPVTEAITKECELKKKPVPRDLWHAVLFYTTGEVVKRTITNAGLGEYTPYAYNFGLYERARGWKDYQKLLELYWQPYIEGKTKFNLAIAQIVNGLKE